MANIVRVRVELKKKYNDPKMNFKDMFQDFKRKVTNGGILHDCKEHQHYESRSEKDRKSRRASRKRAIMEDIEKKIVTGEKIHASPGLVKKVKSNLLKEKKTKKDRRRGSNRESRQYDE